jgi:hypothetical protein
VDDEVEKIRCGCQKKETGFKGLHLHQGHMTVDLTDKNNENDVIRNYRIDFNCYHEY